MPERIQLRRTKGWRKPEGAVVVSRPSKWGNPFRIGQDVETAEEAVWRYRAWLNGPSTEAWLLRQIIKEDLGDRDLCCWCPLDQPCHADVLLELANEGTS